MTQLLRPPLFLLVLAVAFWGSKLVAKPTAAAPKQLDPAKVEAVVDAAMGELMSKTWAPGAIVTVVQGGRLLLVKGYGVRNVETKAAVDPRRTLFRIGSITKLMTTAAALRLAERGNLNLGTDVNSYLTSVKVPNRLGPVSARDLMIHRGGFDTAIFHLSVPTDQLTRLGHDAMQRELIRLRPTSAPPIYDNLGFGVLGQVVADVRHSSYRQAIAEEIFAPLGMTQSVVGLPSNRVQDAASCYMLGADWQPTQCQHGLLQTIGQGGGDVSATGYDMGRFMSGLLVPGLLLRDKTLSQLYNFDTGRFHPRTLGLGLAMMELRIGTYPAAGHRGEINGFVSRLVLFPQADVGVFISLNGSIAPPPMPRLSSLFQARAPEPRSSPRKMDPDTLQLEFLRRFTTLLLPEPMPSPLKDFAGPDLPPADLAGLYGRLDATRTLMGRIGAILGGVRLWNEGKNLASERCTPFVRAGPNFYECGRAGEPPIGIGFVRDKHGIIFAGLGGPNVLERLPWWRTPKFILYPVPFLLLVNLSAFAALLFVRRKENRGALLLAGVTSTILIGALLMELQFAYDLGHGDYSNLILLWRVLFPIAAIAFLVNAWLAGRAAYTDATSRAGVRGRLSALYLLAIAVCGLALAALLLVWHLLLPWA